MTKAIPFLFAILTSCTSYQEKSIASPTANQVEITVTEETPRALKVKETLEVLLKKHDLSLYLFTRKVVIQPKSIPQSHPVLTLNTRHTEPNQILSNFLHEEIHWFLVDRKNDTNAAISNLKNLFPKVPAGGKEGARDEESTYLHLIVNYLELQADRKYLGKEVADSLIQNNDVYTWIYKQVLLREPEIKEVVHKYKLEI